MNAEHCEPPVRDGDAQTFFRAQHAAFSEAIRCSPRARLVESLMAQAFDSFEGNARIQASDQPVLDCQRGCAACCTLRVTATPPEALLVARFLRHTAETFRRHGLDPVARLHEADVATRGLGEVQRVSLRQRCPFIEKGSCVIYPVRPLACRGYASFDRAACADAASGQLAQVPHSEPHRWVRSMVQGALEAALRTHDLAWQPLELNAAVGVALADEQAESRWLNGEAALSAPVVGAREAREMESVFDTLLGPC